MEIRAGCRYDFETVKALSHISIYKKKDPRKTFIFRNIFYALMALVIILEMLAFGVDTLLICLLTVSAILLALNFFMYIIIPRIQFRSLHNMVGVENEYTFCDDCIKVSSKGEMYCGNEELKYSLIPKVLETSTHFFIYQNLNLVYVVDKSSIRSGTAYQIREKLTPYVKDKYIICKY